jgi:membrane protease YdiL (CAAX protease family)
MILGVILGYLYWYSGSLFPAIAGHFVFNSFQILLLYYKVINAHQQAAVSDNFLTITGIIGVGFVIFLFYRLRKNSKTNYSRVYDEPMPGPSGEYISKKLF